MLLKKCPAIDTLLMCYTCTCTWQHYKGLLRDITSALFCKLINADILLLFLTILIRYKAEIDTLLMRYTHVPFQVYLSIINFMDIYSISYQAIGGRVVRAVDLKSGGLAMLVVQILPWTRFFCNVHLFRVPCSCTGSVQMKSSMTFIRGNRFIEREKANFKSREVKRFKECALANLCVYHNNLCVYQDNSCVYHHNSCVYQHNSCVSYDNSCVYQYNSCVYHNNSCVTVPR